MKTLRLLFAPLSLLSAFAIGLSCPWLNAYKAAVPYLVMGMLFLVFLQLNWNQLRIRASVFAIVAANLAIPLTFYFIFSALNQPVLAVGAFMAGIAPTGSAAPSVISFLKQNIEYGVTAFVMTTFTVAVAIPLILPHLLPEAADKGFLELFLPIAQRVGFLIFIPVGVSLIIRWIAPSSKNRFPKAYRMISFLLWVCCITIMLSGASNTIWNELDASQRWFVPMCFLTALAVCVTNFTLGHFLSKEFPRESSQTLGQKNIAVTVALAMEFCEPMVAIVPLMYILCHNSWNSWQMIRLSLKEERESSRDA
ncbi:MAG: hypothetical protein IJF84_04095 [Thermoguttaceae bacterium]|nr:hypothetical protein [Thermoguttaceae bacterium]